MLMATCHSARKFVEQWDSGDVLKPDIYFGEGGNPNNGTEAGREFIEHVQSCAECKAWLRNEIPDEEIERLRRIKEYCCIMMFVAVEEPKRDDFHLKFRYFRDESFWILEQPKNELGFVSFNFCHWCGHKLPNHPFISDDKGKG